MKKTHRESPYCSVANLLRSLLIASVLLAVPVCGEDFAVSVVASDDTTLSRPVSREQPLDSEGILAMVRRAVDLVGGMAAVVPDTARLVVIKPNIVMAMEPETGVITDPRLVRAVAILVHEVAPRARLLVAEGAGAWISPSKREEHGIGVPLLGRLFADMHEDGFEVGGYREMVGELREKGLDIDCFDLNFDRHHTFRAPEGGMGMQSYDIAAAVIEADAWINCPVTKTHGSKITCAMKNHVGLLPGMLYGFSKDSGTENHSGMLHYPSKIDEVIVDLWRLAEVDLNVVDGIIGRQAGGLKIGEPIRTNLVLAGRDPVAVDLVAAKLMGFNPDDMEFAELARQNGMGPGRYENVEVIGGEVEKLARRFKKAGKAYPWWMGMSLWGAHADYGMGPRYWTLLGPKPQDHAFSAEKIAELSPVPGEEGWSPVAFFGHDKIFLGEHFDDSSPCAVYCFTRFAMAKSDSVRFWVGSAEGLRVWIDGKEIYAYERKQRSHRLGMERLPGYVEAGEHSLLVRVEQQKGMFGFSFNICEPIDDELYAGNRYPGVRYHVEDR